MDTKNVIAAISLSAAVIILYGLFFSPTPQDPKQIQKKDNTTVETTNTDAPALDQSDEILKISREEALKENKRIFFENDNIRGSINLTGGTIDNLEFKKFKETK